MNKEDYIREKLEDTFRLWLERATLWGCFLFVSLAWLDYLVAPEHFLVFLGYRAVVSVLLLFGYFLTKRVARRHLSVLAFVLVCAAAVAIELMILRFGGHESPYYVGMILMNISVVGFIPARFLFHLILSMAIYVIYLVPIVYAESLV